MEVIGYYKNKSIIEVIIGDRLKQILRERFYLVKNEQWINSKENGEWLIQYVPNFNSLSSNEQSVIRQGQLHSFSFSTVSTLILNFKLSNLNSNITSENEIIKSIQSVNDKLTKDEKNHSLSMSFPTQNEIIQFKQQLIKCLVALGSSLSISAKSINERVDFIVDTLQTVAAPSSRTSSSSVDHQQPTDENELKSMAIKESGNKQFLDKDYVAAESSFKQALELEGLSNLQKSILSLNCSTSCFEQNGAIIDQLEKQDIVHAITHDFRYLQDAKYYGLLSIVNRPGWWKSYYRLAKILIRMGNYQDAESFSKAALNLIELDPSSTSFKSTISNLYKEANKKGGILMTHGMTFGGAIDGGIAMFYRHFDNDITAILKNMGNLVETHFRDLKLTNDYVSSVFTVEEIQLFKSYSTSTGLSLNHIYEVLLTKIADEIYNLGNYEKAYQFYSRCVGNNSKLSKPYVMVAKMITASQITATAYNSPLICSLYLHATLKPIAFKLNTKFQDNVKNEMFESNHFNIYAKSKVGLMYRYSFFGSDVDFEKSVHYLLTSINEGEKYYPSSNYFNYGNSYSTLGSMNYFGYLDSDCKRSDKDGAKKTWIDGASKGDFQSLHLFKQYFSDNQSDIDLAKSIELKYKF